MLKGFKQKVKKLITKQNFNDSVGKYIIKRGDDDIQKDDLTLICCFSRSLYVPMFFKALHNLDIPHKKVHLLVYDNTEDVILQRALEGELEDSKLNWKSVKLYKSYLKGRGSVTGSGNEQFEKSVLYNIWDMWINLKPMIKTETFMQLEDDTIFPPDAFTKLYPTLMSDEKIGFVTSIATGRSSYPWVAVRLGVHNIKICRKCYDRDFKVLERRSFHPDTKGIQEVDCAGVYCFVAKTKAYLTGFDGFDATTMKVPFFAMDNVLTWNMKQHDYKILADFDVWCKHLHASAARIIAWGKEQAREMADLYLPEYNNYAQGVEVLSKDHKPRSHQVRIHAPSWEL